MSLPPAYDSIKDLGVYDQLPYDVKLQLLEVPNLPLSAQVKAQEAVAQQVADPETTDKLMQEVIDLADSAVKVDEAFERVRVGLGRVDENDYKDKNGNPIPKFQPTWKGYQARWTALLWGSRDVATKTEAYINDFLEVIVPQVEAIQNVEDLADARLDLQQFVKREAPEQLNSKETADQALKYSQNFTDLRRDLEEFQGRFDDFAKDHKVELGIEITNKQAEIQALDLEIKKCQTVVMAMAIALGVTIFVAATGAVAALAALGPLGPVVALGIAIVGVIAAVTELGVLIGYIVETNKKEEEKARAQRDLESLQAQLKYLEELQAILQSQKEDITDICARLDRFAAIWNLVKHDAGLIDEGLNAAIGDQGSKTAFKKRVSLIKDSYTKLRDALNLYATKINKSKLNA